MTIQKIAEKDILIIVLAKFKTVRKFFQRSRYN
jgi:hypothetical protein